MSKELISHLQNLLSNAVAVSGDLPIEILAGELRGFADANKDRTKAIALLSDPLVGGLLYRWHPKALFERLENAAPLLDRATRFQLVQSLLTLAPIRSEDVLRYVELGLNLLDLHSANNTETRDSWSDSEKLIVYRWASISYNAAPLLATQIVKKLATRGIQNDGEDAWEVFQGWFGFRVTVLLTPEQSPAARRRLTELHREEWLTLPVQFGSDDSSVSIDELDDDSSAQNASDSDSIMSVLQEQRSPWSDFTLRETAWHPRQMVATVTAEVEKNAILRVPAATFDRAPIFVATKELNPQARALKTLALAALFQAQESRLPADLALRFVYGNDQKQLGLFEFALPTQFVSDGPKHTVQIYLGDPARILTTMERFAGLSPATLPRMLAALLPETPRIFIRTPKGPAFEYTVRNAEAFGVSGQGQPAFSDSAAVSQNAMLGTWRGQATDASARSVSFLLEVNSGAHGLQAITTLDARDSLAMVGFCQDQRLALRSSEKYDDNKYLECEYRSDGTLEGHYSLYAEIYQLLLRPEASAKEASIDGLVQDALHAHERRATRIDLAAVRLPIEHDILHELFSDSQFRAEYQESASNRALGTDATRLAQLIGRGATELSPAMIPSVFRARDAVLEAIGFSGTVALWVHNSSALNASVTTHENSIIIHFSSGVLDVFNETEITAVIAHELAHVLFGNHELQIRTENARLSGNVERRYFALRRAQEISCDRVALIACKDPEAVVISQTILRTGIHRRELFGGVEALIANAWQEVERLKARRDPWGPHDSHPYAALRIAALDTWTTSAAKDAVPVNVSAESRLQSIMGLLVQHGHSDADHSSPADVARFHALAVMKLIECDDRINIGEVAATAKLEPDIAAALHAVAEWSSERRAIELSRLRTKVIAQLAMDARERLLLELVRFARTDHFVHSNEVNVIQTLGHDLQVKSPSFNQVMDNLQKSQRWSETGS